MKKRLFSVAAVACAAALCTVLFAACGGGEEPGDQPGVPVTYTIAAEPSEDYTLTPSKTSAQAGEEITVTAESKNADKYITGVTFNGTACEEEEGGYSFTMPAANVTLAAATESYVEVLDDGRYSLSEPASATLAVNSGEATLRIDFSQRVWNARCEAESTNEAVVPQDAIGTDVHFADGTQADYATVTVDTSKITAGSTWFRVSMRGNSSSDRGELLFKVTVGEEVVEWNETLVFDVQDLIDELGYDENVSYELMMYPENTADYTTFDDLSAEDGEVTVGIKYRPGVRYRLSFRAIVEGAYHFHSLLEAVGQGSTATGLNQYMDGILTFSDEGVTLRIGVSEDYTTN